METNAVQEAADTIADNVEKVIVGKRQAILQVLVAILCEGHVLLEDVPGVGKTLLAKSVARSLDCSFKRIQFTPDLLPSDVSGINYFNQKEGDFTFLPGPVMANVVLADEINRATPRTQSCLLEAMQERQVTIDAKTMPLPRPFLVLATQNPVEQEGTFPLPEAQLDRFLIKISQGYPSAGEEAEILKRFESSTPLDTLEPVISAEKLQELMALYRGVHVDDSVRDYLVALVRTTRGHESVFLGASPRAAQALYWASQAQAATQGRGFVTPDDIKALAEPVLAHRIVLKPEAEVRGGGKGQVIFDALESVPVPI